MIPDDIVHQVNVVLMVPRVGRNGNMRMMRSDIP
jgi:hypothetical protein